MENDDKIESGIYMIVSPVEHYYIGSSMHCQVRFKKHLTMLRKNKHENPIMQKVFNKHEGDWKLVILEKVSIEELLTVEQKYLDIHMQNDRCMNIIHEAYKPPVWPKNKKRGPMSEEVKLKLSLSNMGQKRSEETKENIRKSKKGITFSREIIEKRKETRKKSGYVMSEATKTKISEKLKNRPKSETHKAKISQSLKGRKHSNESILKIQQAGLGRKHSEESKQKMRASKLQRDSLKKLS